MIAAFDPLFDGMVAMTKRHAAHLSGCKCSGCLVTTQDGLTLLLMLDDMARKATMDHGHGAEIQPIATTSK